MRRMFLLAVTGCMMLVSAHFLSAAAKAKATVCHGAVTGQGRVLEVAPEALPDHFSHGDVLTDLPKGAACSADEFVPM